MLMMNLDFFNDKITNEKKFLEFLKLYIITFILCFYMIYTDPNIIFCIILYYTIPVTI